MTKRAIALERYRSRNPRRSNIFKELARASARGYSADRVAALRRELEVLPLAICPKCGDSYRSHNKKTGECT